MRIDLMIAVLIGLAGGTLAMMTAGADRFTGPLCGAGTGALIILIAHARCVSPGAGLLWGMAVALLAWIIGPVWLIESCSSSVCTSANTSAHVPLLTAYLLQMGLPIGLVVGIRARLRQSPPPRSVRESWSRTLVVGLTCGILGTALFSLLGVGPSMDPVRKLFPEGMPGRIISLLQYPAGAAFGALFGLLFQRDLRGLGSTAGWGFAYGILWWFLVPHTLVPALTGKALPWSNDLTAADYPNLVSHALLGLFVGLAYAITDRAWVTFFHDSDPLTREFRGPGPQLLRIAGSGAKAGFIGGLLALGPMAATGILPYVARLIGAESEWVGAPVHLTIATVFGALYGLLYHDEAPDTGMAFGWGMFYGLMLWFVGQLSIFSWLLGHHFSWSIEDVGTSLPSLVSHLVFGCTTGLIFALLERRYHRVDPLVRISRRQQEAMRGYGTPAPALWLVAIMIGVLFPILVG